VFEYLLFLMSRENQSADPFFKKQVPVPSGKLSIPSSHRFVGVDSSDNPTAWEKASGLCFFLRLAFAEFFHRFAVKPCLRAYRFCLRNISTDPLFWKETGIFFMLLAAGTCAIIALASNP
jgi:hypothetical protein